MLDAEAYSVVWLGECRSSERPTVTNLEIPPVTEIERLLHDLTIATFEAATAHRGQPLVAAEAERKKAVEGFADYIERLEKRILKLEG